MKLFEVALRKMFMAQEYKDHLGEIEPWGEIMKTLPNGSQYLYDIFTDPSEDYRALQSGVADYANHPELRAWQAPDGRVIVLDMLEFDPLHDPQQTLQYFDLGVSRQQLEKHLTPFSGMQVRGSETRQ